ncbi:MAG: hypothetical protein CL693_14755 [Cellvibrionaceae bacterium]|nr:hypothetical protein [Cellvibrionaceae bacterium]|tara:strand:+ start:9951 stop:12074 length:2124 start_codon:yes stop_codon:yes gene_type:complete
MDGEIWSTLEGKKQEPSMSNLPPANDASPALLAKIPGILYRCLNDSDWTMLELSGAVADITGYEPYELLNNHVLSFADLIVEDDRSFVASVVADGLAADGSYYIDYRIQTRAGELVHLWEHGHGLYDDAGQLIELVGYIYNATSNVRKLERKRQLRDAAVQLARNPHLARGDVEVFAREVVTVCCEALGVSSADIWLFDESKTRLDVIVYYNVKGDRFGSGMSISASQYPNYFEEAVKSRVIDASDAQNDPRTREFNKHFLLPFNVESILHCPIRQGGDLVGVVALEQVGDRRRWRDAEINFVGDVADQMAHVLSNREIREAENRLLAEQSSSEAKTHFLSIMSHEVRTPLNGVLGVADLLSMTDLNPKQMEYVGLIEESGKLLLKIIGDILDFTKINSGQLDIRSQPTDLRGLCRDCMELVRPQASGKKLKLDIAISESVPKLCELDALRLQQVLLNLLANAVKFTSEGEVALRVETLQRGKTSFLGLRVVDTGVGISDELATKIFEPFTQDRAQNLNASLKGAGLGLPICRGLVSLMDGEIELQSELGQGSAFQIILPLKAADSSLAPSVASREPEFDFSHLRVLAVEDNLVNQKVVAGMLKRYGVTADICDDGKQALELIETTERAYDLILMDCEMPVMDGFEAVERIRRLPPPKGSVFIVALTAHALQAYRQRAEQVGMNDYLTKPFKRQALQQLLSRFPRPE